MDEQVPDLIQQLMQSLENGFLRPEEALVQLAAAMSLQPRCAHFTHEGKSAITLLQLHGKFSLAPEAYVYGGRCALCHQRFDAMTAHRLAHAHIKPHDVPEFRGVVDFVQRELLPVVSVKDLKESASLMGKSLDATMRRALIRELVAHDTVVDIFQEAA